MTVLDPFCPRCRGAGEIEVGTHRDEFGNWDTEWYPCPGCPGCPGCEPLGVRILPTRYYT